jgi:hypothetical protein
VSQGVVSLIERGRLEEVSLARIRAVAAALDIAVSVDAWWRSGNADRLVDRAHAALVEHVVGVLRDHGWLTRVEVTFNHFGDRGSADVVAWLPAEQVLLIVEVKSMIGDVQATASTFEREVRVLPGLLRDEEGWAPLVVARLLVLADTHANRDVVREHPAVFDSIWPERTATVRRWLRDSRARRERREVGTGRQGFGGIWFIDLDRIGAAGARARQVTRVRPRRSPMVKP